MLEILTNTFNNFFNNLLLNAPNILTAVIILVITFLIGRVFTKLFLNKIKSKVKDSLLALFLGQVCKWMIYLFGILAALQVLGFGYFAASLLTGAGISAIIIGFAFKDIAENFLAGILLAINRPFNIGDIIEIEKFKGTIKNLELRTTHIRTADGRDIYVPNSALIKSSLVNYTKDGLLRLDFGIGLATETNIEEVRKLILDHLKTIDRILKNPPANVIVEELGVSTIDIRVLFWIDIFKTKTDKPDTLGDPVRSQIIREVKELLLSKGYNLPASIIEHKMYDLNSPLIISGKQIPADTKTPPESSVKTEG